MFPNGSSYNVLQREPLFQLLPKEISFDCPTSRLNDVPLCLNSYSCIQALELIDIATLVHSSSLIPLSKLQDYKYWSPSSHEHLLCFVPVTTKLTMNDLVQIWEPHCP